MMNVPKSIFRWDRYSDQPAILHKRVKRSLRRFGISDFMKSLLASLRLFGHIPDLIRPRRFRSYLDEDRIGLCINLERPFEDKKILSGSEILQIIEPLNLRRLAIRIPLHDVGNLQDYVDFVERFHGYEILAVILQDRAFVEDKEKLQAALRRIFGAFRGRIGCYQIGNAVNRLKWGFVSQREYFEFFETAWRLRNREFPEVKLLGGAVIDFDPLAYCRSLHNGFTFEYDGYAALLYVDRRGAPEERQLGCNLQDKISLLCRIMRKSGKLAPHPGEPRLWITEVNWPLRDTGLHAPAAGDCLVGEREQLCFLVRYFLLSLATGSVAACFWHQLVAPGYGLIDNRGGAVRRRPAFYGFATLCRLFNGAYIDGFDRQETLGYYRLVARKDGSEIQALWCYGRVTSIPMPPGKRAMEAGGRTLSTSVGRPVTIGESPIYLVDD